MAIEAVFGLGNPEDRYAPTRHNLGARAVATYLQGRRTALPRPQEVGPARVYPFPDHLVVFPQTFMNLSGRAVAAVVQAFTLKPEALLIVYDDVALPFGRLRLRPGGGAGGHNGMASVLEALGTRAVPRLRLGIGDDVPADDLVGYVLAPFTPEEEKRLPDFLIRAARAIDYCVRQGLTAAMNRFNVG